MKYETFQEKLDRFLKEPVGFLVKSKEIADELAKVFERNHMKTWSGRSVKEFMTVALDEAREFPGDAYVCYNVEGHEGNLAYGTSDLILEDERELLDVTLDELKEYLESSPQTFEDKLKLFKAGTHVLHTPTQEIYDKLMVELEKRGYVWHGGQSMTTYGFTDAGHGRKDLCIQWNGFEDKRVNCGYIKCRKQDGLGIIELTPEDFKRNKQGVHMKITIETDGHHKTTAECNGITAESLCSPTDEFKLPKGVHMAVQRLLEKLEEDTGFHVGDIVKVLGTGTHFLVESVGLQGKIVEYDKNDNTYLVEFPVSFAGDNKWWYLPDALKLIRRGNN